MAISMQSGSLGASFLELAEQQALGLSWFVSLGDRADVSGTDLLQFFEDDESTRVIGMYTEDLGDPRRFARIARRVSQRRPIVAVRTGAELGPTNSALYRHCGLIEVPTVAALLDTVQGAGHASRCCAATASPCSPTIRARSASPAGPSPPAGCARSIRRSSSTSGRRPPTTARRSTAALQSDDVDGLMVVYAPPLAEAVGGPVAEIERCRGRRAASRSPPCCWPPPTARSRPARAVPNFMFPEPAAAVLGRSWAYGRWLATEAASPPAAVDGVDVDRVNELLAAARLAPAPSRLDPAATADCCRRTASACRRPASSRPPTPSTRPTRSASRSPSRPATATSGARCGPASPSTSPTPPTCQASIERDARRARRRRRLRRRPGDGPARPRPAHPRRTVDDEAGAGGLGRHRRASRPASSATTNRVRLAPLSRAQRDEPRRRVPGGAGAGARRDRPGGVRRHADPRPPSSPPTTPRSPRSTSTR